MKKGSGALALLAAAVLLAATAGRSAPQGLRVLPVDAGLVSAFAFDARDPNVVYVGTIPGANQGRVYKSIDGGEHWRLVSGRGWTWLGALAADPRRPGTLYAGTGNAVYQTTDGGQTWRTYDRGLLPPPGVNRGEGWVDWLAVDPTNSNVLYEHDYANTIRKSLDGGQTWHPVLSFWHKRGWTGGVLMAPRRPPTLYGAFAMFQYPGGPRRLPPPSLRRSGRRGVESGVYVTMDGGKTWRNTGLGARFSGPNPGPIAFAADPPGTTIYVAIGDRIFSSTSVGRNWSSGRRLPEVSTYDLTTMAQSLAAGAGIVYAALGTKGIYQTGDAGQSWTKSWPDSGSAPGLGAGLVVVDPARPTTIFASAYYPDNRPTGTHVLRSTDSGRTWTVMG